MRSARAEAGAEREARRLHEASATELVRAIGASSDTALASLDEAHRREFSGQPLSTVLQANVTGDDEATREAHRLCCVLLQRATLAAPQKPLAWLAVAESSCELVRQVIATSSHRIILPSSHMPS